MYALWVLSRDHLQHRPNCEIITFPRVSGMPLQWVGNSFRVNTSYSHGGTRAVGGGVPKAHVSLARVPDAASSSPLRPAAVWRPGHPADCPRPAALHHLLHRRGGLHLRQLLQQRAHSGAENTSCSTLGPVLAPSPDAGLQDSLLPVGSPALP